MGCIQPKTVMWQNQSAVYLVGTQLCLKKLLLGYEVLLRAATKPQRVMHHAPECHLGLGKNPIKVWMSMKISRADGLKEFCRVLQHQCFLDFSLALQMEFRKDGNQPLRSWLGAHLRSCLGLPLGAVRTQIRYWYWWLLLANPDSQSFCIHCFCFMKSC